MVPPDWHRLASATTRLVAVVCLAAAGFPGVTASNGAALGAAATHRPTGGGPGDAAVVVGRSLALPADGGAHPAYRAEWWYVTGWLRDEGGHQRGFQLTFFRVRSGLGEDNPSRFAPRQLLLAHAAISDPARGRLVYDQRAERTLDPLVGAAPDHTDLRLRDWSLSWADGSYRIRLPAAGFALDLVLRPSGPPMIHGDRGYSRKDADPRFASYYYSQPQLEISGELGLSGRRYRVEGRAWLDHEWSSTLLPAHARGWDWVGINLDDGGALMAFRTRDHDERALWAGGTVRRPDGGRRILAPDQIRFVPLRRWRSPRSGAGYPVEWLIELRDGAALRRLRLVPLMDDQELDARSSTGAIYWEGAVRVLEDGREIGRGYLELTGYSGRPPV